jgi:hypothetical protein
MQRNLPRALHIMRRILVVGCPRRAGFPVTQMRRRASRWSRTDHSRAPRYATRAACSAASPAPQAAHPLCRDGVCVKLGNRLHYPNLPVTEREPTFLLCVLDVCALPLPRDSLFVPSSPDQPTRAPQLCTLLPRLARPSLLPPAPSRHPPCVFAAFHPRSPANRCLPLCSQSRLGHRTPKPTIRLKHRPRRIG